MAAPILATKLYIPPPRSKIVLRPRLVERMNAGLESKLILVSAPAGFGKTTLLSEWLASGGCLAAWLSLDERDNDFTRFLTYFVAALQTVAPKIGDGMLNALQSPQPPSIEWLLTSLVNEISTLPNPFILVLDDYHMIDSRPVDQALTFLIEHLPPRMHLVISSREDPSLPLARLRARGQLTELRSADLRFDAAEAARFLNDGMGLRLTEEDVAALEARTEGWIAGLQLAAISMQGLQDPAGFIKSFTGSHHFVLDYLVEEVLQRQPTAVQAFLLRTSILDRLCGPLCDAVLQDAGLAGQETLENLERANLFIVPLDNERRWYRYHLLFADLLRHRLSQDKKGIAELHVRASQWLEDNGMEIEALQHAIAAGDNDRAARLVEGKGMPLQFRGGLAPVLRWLESLPEAELNARPALWVMYASASSMVGQVTGVELKLQAAEAALKGAATDAKTRNLVGHIAAIRALLAASQNQVEEIISQSRRALEYLDPDNLAVRTATIWKLGLAYLLQGDRAAARQAFSEAIAISEATGNTIIGLSASIGLGNVQEADNQLHQAHQTYGRILDLIGDSAQATAYEAHFGLARINYEWNNLDTARRHAQQSLQLELLFELAERHVGSKVFLARLRLAHGDAAGAAALLDEAGKLARQHGFSSQLPEIAAVQVVLLLQQGRLEEAVRLAQANNSPFGLARVFLAQRKPGEALAILDELRRQMEARHWENECLKVMLLQALAHRANDDKEKALEILGEALALAEPGGFIRIFVDEGRSMVQLLSEAAASGIRPDYAGRLLSAFAPGGQGTGTLPELQRPGSQVEPLSRRELEVLRLVAQGLSNHEIAARLFLSLNTVKGHNRVIFDKLGAKSRTEAVARARELGLL